MSMGFRTNTRLNLNQSALDHFLNDPDGDVGQSLKKRGRIVVAAAKRQVGVDTGALRESIRMIHTRIGPYQEIHIGSDNDIALIHHEGTRPHDIVPNGPNLMRFQSRGRIVYSAHVLHPGTKPNRFLSDNLPLAIV